MAGDGGVPVVEIEQRHLPRIPILFRLGRQLHGLVVDLQQLGPGVAHGIEAAGVDHVLHHALVEAGSPIAEVPEVLEGPMGLPFLQQLLHDPFAHVLHGRQAETDAAVLHGELGPGPVNVRSKDPDAALAGGVHVLGHRIGVVHIAVDHGGQELHGEIALEIGRPVGGHGVAGSVGFVEGVGSEVHHLVEDMVRHLLLDAPFHGPFHAVRAVDEILPLPGHHVVLLLAHGPADDVGSAQGVAAQGADNLHDLLLIDHTAVGGGEDGLQALVLIVDGAGIVLALDIPGDALHGAWTVEGDASDDILEAVGFELHEELAHARRFQLEHPVRVPSGDHVVYLFVGEIVGGEIRRLLPLLPDEGQGVPDDGQGPKAQKVHLEEAQFLQGGHGELSGQDSIVALERHHRLEGHPGDHHAGRMGGAVAGQPFQLHG